MHPETLSSILFTNISYILIFCDKKDSKKISAACSNLFWKEIVQDTQVIYQALNFLETPEETLVQIAPLIKRIEIPTQPNRLEISISQIQKVVAPETKISGSQNQTASVITLYLKGKSLEIHLENGMAQFSGDLYFPINRFY